MCDGSAQRRPGREPRRHMDMDERARHERDAQRRPGREPRRHAAPARTCARRHCFAQRRPGREPRRHLTPSSPAAAAISAQRRPGREPRRHARGGGQQRHGLVRSTKAGARTPATPADGRAAATLCRRSTKAGARTPATPPLYAAHCHPSFAQRRPGREPRRHLLRCIRRPARCRSLNEGRGANPGDTSDKLQRRVVDLARSTKAGARTPATPSVRSTSPPASTSLNEGRGANPGDTAASAESWSGYVTALNEGRGANPGDTLRPRRRRLPPPARSTKAGARTPATPILVHDHPVRIHRSTKAGARTPATPATPSTRCCPARCAQRRPGREPRRHQRPPAILQPEAARSTKAGARTPATPRVDVRRMHAMGARSTKAGARTPATLARRLGDPLDPLSRSTKAGARTPATPIARPI